MRRFAVIIACAALLLGAPRVGGQTSDEAARLDRREQIRQCRALLKESLALVDTAAYDSAVVLLAAALKCDPNNPDAFFHTGRVKLRLGDTTGAVATLTEGVQKAPLSSRLKLLLARLQIATGTPETAIELVDTVLVVKPREGEAHYLKGLIALVQGDTLQAIEAWEKALEIALARQAP